MNTQLSLQYQVSPSILATVGYVGAQGRRLEGRHEQNPYNATVCLATPGCQAGRAGEFGFPGVGTLADASIFASLGAQSTFLSSNYNSLQATVEKSLSHGLIDFCINNGIIGTGGIRLCPDRVEALIYWKIGASGLWLC